ncbi:MAG: signal peptidase I [Candidatus Saccharibacteria bacterium]|nr:signal peptidase I [Candidatus Saccharibacteria bacterium]
MQQDPTIPQSNYGYTPPSYPPSPRQAPVSSPSPEPPRPPRKKRHPIRSFLANFGILLAAPAIALLLIVFVFQSYEVDGPSMEETLQDGDRLVVLKFEKTLADIRGNEYIPERDSIIIFNKMDSRNSLGGERQLVKRVIALPGERVRVNSGNVTVYNSESPDGFQPDSASEYHDSIDDLTPGNIDLTVNRGEVFVLGDNRDNSSDSRTFGTVPSEQIVGELALRIYPFSSLEAF